MGTCRWYKKAPTAFLNCETFRCTSESCKLTGSIGSKDRFRIKGNENLISEFCSKADENGECKQCPHYFTDVHDNIKNQGTGLLCKYYKDQEREYVCMSPTFGHKPIKKEDFFNKDPYLVKYCSCADANNRVPACDRFADDNINAVKMEQYEAQLEKEKKEERELEVAKTAVKELVKEAAANSDVEKVGIQIETNMGGTYSTDASKFKVTAVTERAGERLLRRRKVWEDED